MFTMFMLSLALTTSAAGAPPEAARSAADVAAVTAGQAEPAAPGPALREYLQRTIERGVPLFNQGQPEACAAVYATALEAVADSTGWGVDAQQRARLGALLEVTAAVEQPVEQAWAYRRIIDALLSGEPLEPPATSAARSLFDFSDPAAIDRWRVVLDGVMGGRSTGKLEQGEGSLIFTGDTSLANNGGFSSIRAPLPAGAVAGYDALRIRVKGDGRTWIVGASSRSGRGGDSYWARFETRDGQWQTITVPVAEMVRQYFGTPIEGRIRPSEVRGVEFYIYDKRSGPFRLEVGLIEAVRTGY